MTASIIRKYTYIKEKKNALKNYLGWILANDIKTEPTLLYYTVFQTIVRGTADPDALIKLIPTLMQHANHVFLEKGWHDIKDTMSYFKRIGNGWVDSRSEHKCPKCQGDGMALSYIACPDCNGKNITCETCKGSGRAFKRVPCPKCKGKRFSYNTPPLPLEEIIQKYMMLPIIDKITTDKAPENR